MKVTMPEEGVACRFGNYKSTIRVPVVIYADFETLHQKVEKRHGQTRLESKHLPCVFSVVVVSDLPEFQVGPFTHAGHEKGPKVRDHCHFRVSIVVRCIESVTWDCLLSIVICL